MFTREYPPHVYGGGGVHVEHLVRHLRHHHTDVDVHCLGQPRPDATAHPINVATGQPVLDVLTANAGMAAAVSHVDLVHSHTWYTNLAGHWASLLHDVPHVMTAHSLEPLRPWKAEQLGGGYELSRWAEHTAITSADAVIAVSLAMRDDILKHYPSVQPERIHVISNGVDTTQYYPDPATDALTRHGIDPEQPYVLFVGRITRQKGLPHLLRAARRTRSGAHFVIVADAPDTPQAATEIETLAAGQPHVHLIRATLPVHELRQLLTHATVFCCPSVYEPLGIVNLEAMACATAVVATAVGGIPEAVHDGVTGTLVPSTGPATDTEHHLAEAIDQLITNPALASALGHAGRDRVTQHFTWDTVATQTADLYAALAPPGHGVGETGSSSEEAERGAWEERRGST
nr:glycogen synthase [Kineosporia babensis]